MEHKDAVRIAQSGEGAIVAELIRLDRAYRMAKEDYERISEKYEEALEIIERIESTENQRGE